jgi:hypothetical protein
MAGSFFPSEVGEPTRRDREQAARNKAKPLGFRVYRTRGRYLLQRDRSSIVIEWPLTLDELEDALTRLASEHLDGCQG